ncbi:MAG: ankyrin repeat domain-containing protein [Alphaproteobacteria bacterium]
MKKLKKAAAKLKQTFASASTRKAWELMEEMGTHPEFALPGHDVRSNRKMLDLIAAGADLTLHDRNGWTMLMRASFFGCAAAVPALLEKGADVHAREIKVEGEGYTRQSAIILAAMKGHADIVGMLLKAGANPNDADTNGQTALHFAWDADTVETLLRAGADLERRDNWGRTPLILQAHGEISEGLDVMLKWGASLEAKDNEGNNALAYAQQMPHPRYEALRERVVKAYNADAAEKLPVVQESFSVRKPLTLKPRNTHKFAR